MSTLGSVWQEGALRGKVCLRFWKTVNTLQLLLSLGEMDLVKHLFGSKAPSTELSWGGE